jgi:putative Mg2+ transporter-C (MgtC) family protein
MDWQVELLFAARVVLATLAGGLIGWERESHGRDAGIRTYAAVSLGACTFALISQHGGSGDPGRIAAQVVSGIGFLGAGAILRQDDRVLGLTTAATLWATAAVGVAMGFGMYVLAFCTAILVLAVLLAHDHPQRLKLRLHHIANDPE